MEGGSLMRPLLSVPVPSWGDLFFSLFRHSASDRQLAGPWCRSGDDAYLFSRSSWSLAVIARWRQLAVNRETVTVWVPDYYCNSALYPLREIGVNLVFYPVNDRMTLDPETCERLEATSVPDIVVLVHYFGQPTSAGNVVDICKRLGSWLVEDAAHVLRPAPGIGEIGDCVLYSPHKHLPIPDGALLIVRKDGPACLGGNVSGMERLGSAIAMETEHRHTDDSILPPTVKWLIKRGLQRLGIRYRNRKLNSFVEDPGSAPMGLISPQMSELGKRLLGRLLPSIELIARIREERALDWQHVLPCVDMPVSCLSSATTPYLAGFYCEQEQDSIKIFEWLQRNCFPVTTWPDLPPEVSQCPKLHATAIRLRRTRFYLPVHQSLKRYQIFAAGRRLLNFVTQDWCVRRVNKDEWEVYWRKCLQPNLLQSWQYGAAKEEAEGWRPNRYLVSDHVGDPVAIAQILSRDLPVLGGIARMNRGPLIISHGEIPQRAELSVQMAAMCTLFRTTNRQRWWMLLLAPEVTLSSVGESGLRMLGLRKLHRPPWESALMSLEVCEDDLLMRLNGKWRNCLRKGEKMGVVVTHRSPSCDETRQLLRDYSQFQKSRGFAGPSDKLIKALIAQPESSGWCFNIFVATKHNDAPDVEPLGKLVTIESGGTALYLIGLTSGTGRRMQANSVLLWKAILHAKNEGCKLFDIGGLGKATPSGIGEFKRGLNGEPYKLIGEWWKLSGL
jgi:hypothetical protein